METPAAVVHTVHYCAAHSRCRNDRGYQQQSGRPDPGDGDCATLFVLHLMRLISLLWLRFSGAAAAIDDCQSSCSSVLPLLKQRFWVEIFNFKFQHN